MDDALRAVGMYEFREHAPHLLSGGQKQRVAIAGVIAMQPRCIVLDEPTAMLDPIGRSEVLRTIRDLNRKKGVTVVLITHHMDEAAQADRLVVMTKGRVIADGPPRQVFQDVEGLRSVGLTVPDTTQLLWELRQEGLDVPPGRPQRRGVRPGSLSAAERCIKEREASHEQYREKAPGSLRASPHFWWSFLPPGCCWRCLMTAFPRYCWD